MFDQDHVQRLRSSVEDWNAWRVENGVVIPRLAEADLSRTRLAGANLSGARLHGADLRGADLQSANLSDARLGEAHLGNARLTSADLSGADLTEARLRKATLYKAHLDKAKLAGADLREAKLTAASMRGANLEGANLCGALLDGQNLFATYVAGDYVTLNGANLKDANLAGASLWCADLSAADLRGANLTDANMVGTKLVGALLDRAILINTKLNGADLSGASIYGISAWNLHTQDTTQQGLIVRRSEGDSPFVLDDLEVAQFIYMMLENQRVRNVIDKITTKVVLLLGRFSPEHKLVLDRLRDELRRRSYLPIIFDFEKPDNRDLTETVSTLAHLARFIIADLTEAKSLPQELMRIVPALPSVPVQPILLAGAAEYAMFEHFSRYPWVLKEIQYRSADSLIAALDEKIIGPAETMAQQQTAYPAAVPSPEIV